MKFVVLMLCFLMDGCTSQATRDQIVLENGGDAKGFEVDPAFPAGAAVMKVLRRHLSSDYIALTRAQVTSDGSYDYVRFFAGFSIVGGFESVTWRYLVFAKKKNQKWSEARVFDAGRLPMAPFAGPIDLLEREGYEFGKKPILVPEPTSGLAPGRGSS